MYVLRYLSSEPPENQQVKGPKIGPPNPILVDKPTFRGLDGSKKGDKLRRQRLHRVEKPSWSPPGGSSLAAPLVGGIFKVNQTENRSHFGAIWSPVTTKSPHVQTHPAPNALFISSSAATRARTPGHTGGPPWWGSRWRPSEVALVVDSNPGFPHFRFRPGYLEQTRGFKPATRKAP